tara:strand:- start:190 stop:1587 length:1398 start_codon:yes stop_codon:yes gene_type:complete
MKKKINLYYLTIWLLTILITIIWTYENPEKIKKLKDLLKYDFSVGKIFSNIKSKVVQKNYKLLNKNTTTEIDSAYNLLSLDHYTIPVYSSYGGIENMGNDILYLSGDSDLFLLKENDDDLIKYEFIKIPIDKIKNNKKSFVEDNESKVGKNAEKYFGIKDILVEKFEGFENKLLLVSTLNYRNKENCYVVSVFYAEILNEKLFKLSNWKDLFSTSKCLSIDLTTNPRFAAASAGGRLIKLDKNSILFSIGDFYADGVNGPMLSQDLSNLYGKIIKINMSNFKSKIFSSGHRNPQGLHIDKDNNIFATEHGPTGGDEINAIYENNNYGWPYATYGTNYKSSDAYKKIANDNNKKWPIDQSKNKHNNYTKPIFSWGNQVGISNLVSYENNYFDKWNKNLIISALASKQLIRVIYNYETESFIYKENIIIGKRIRDIVLMDNGKIALLTDRGKELSDYPEIIIMNKKN